MCLHPFAEETSDSQKSKTEESRPSKSKKKLQPSDKLEEMMDLDEDADPLKMNKGEIDSDLTCTKEIPYTAAQKKRLDQIYHRIYMDYIDLIETYAWAGALTQDQKLIRYNMLKNYVLTFQKRNYKWCSEYEEDEWEEEWFNSDND